jgi:hypothetical protein
MLVAAGEAAAMDEDEDGLAAAGIGLGREDIEALQRMRPESDVAVRSRRAAAHP